MFVPPSIINETANFSAAMGIVLISATGKIAKRKFKLMVLKLATFSYY